MSKGPYFSKSEDDFIITNYKKMSVRELVELHGELRRVAGWPRRTEKSIRRRIERLRIDKKLLNYHKQEDNLPLKKDEYKIVADILSRNSKDILNRLTPPQLRNKPTESED